MFKAARLKLTLWYLLIIMFISIAFSGVIYRLVSIEIERFARSPRFRLDNMMIYESMIDEAQGRVALSLIELNGVILVVSGTLGYVLAGITLAPIQKMVEEQKRFVGDASHELRTPLTALKSMLEVGLRDKKMTLKDARKLIREGIEEGDKLTNLSDSLLELARLESNGNKIDSVKLKVSEIVEEAIKKISPQAKKKNIKIVKLTNHVQIKGNKEKITELLLILLDNAVKYSPDNTKITIQAKQIKNYVVIKVIDRGIGISTTDLPHIFERFYRSDSARSKTGEGGYGLGLAIAKKIVDQHSGSIAVISSVGHGTEFKITLPLFS
ncbi:MAG: HAMP domain-containing sensor histidine kinase [Candidatus Shapirobacteria bacterium]|jgi:signal transduction histidine kinase